MFDYLNLITLEKCVCTIGMLVSQRENIQFLIYLNVILHVLVESVISVFFLLLLLIFTIYIYIVVFEIGRCVIVVLLIYSPSAELALCSKIMSNENGWNA